MKKILCFVVILSLLLVGCAPTYPTVNAGDTQYYITGVWLTYAELDKMLQGDFKTTFNTAVQNCKSRGVTDMFVHAVPFCDSYYRSKLLPTRTSVASIDFDIFEYMIAVCHQNSIKFHAWINPYRVRTANSDISALPAGSPAKKWLTDENADNDINVSTLGGIYLNPASSESRMLIIDAVREIIGNYGVDGIHFDDYFYPTQDESFDAKSYTAYCENNQNPISLADFRRANVNALISGAYTAIKFKDKNIVFSVSPSASVDENFNKHYADVTAWCDSGCVDYIIPQLYFGFSYPDDNFKFENLLADWQQIIKDNDVRLLIGLGVYKIGTDSEPDRQEWANGRDVISQQVEICQDTSDIGGHIYFSYSSMCEYL